MLEHVGGDQLVDGADGREERVGRDLGYRGDVGASAAVDVAQLRREPILHGGAPGQRVGPGAEDLDQERPGEPGACRERLQVDAHRGTVRRQPIGRKRLERLVDSREQFVDAGVVGGEEAIVLVRELLVERLARDAGALDDVGDNHAPVPLLGNRLHDRREHPRALGLADDRPGRGVAPARQYREHAGFGRRRHGNIIVHW